MMRHNPYQGVIFMSNLKALAAVGAAVSIGVLAVTACSATPEDAALSIEAAASTTTTQPSPNAGELPPPDPDTSADDLRELISRAPIIVPPLDSELPPPDPDTSADDLRELISRAPIIVPPLDG